MIFTKENLLLMLWVPYALFLFWSIMVACIFTPSHAFKETVSGLIYSYPQWNFLGNYTSLDSLTDEYCVTNNSIIIIPKNWSNCTSEIIADKNLYVFLIMLSVLSLWIMFSIVWALIIDISQENYYRMIIIMGLCMCTICFICLYISHYQPMMSNYFLIPSINSGIMTYYNKSCYFNSTFQFKTCYCHSYNDSPLNVTHGSTCQYLPNIYLFGLMVSGLGIIGFIIIYYLSHMTLIGEPLF